MFETKHNTEETVIHGLEERSIYSDIDHLAKAVALPSSSESESEDDFVYVEGIQNFSRKTNVKQWKEIKLDNIFDNFNDFFFFSILVSLYSYILSTWYFKVNKSIHLIKAKSAFICDSCDRNKEVKQTFR